MLAWLPSTLTAQPQPATSLHPRFPGTDLFTNRLPVSLEIQITASNLEVLRKESREFVPALVIENQTRLTNVALHLKGSIGSFRSVDDKPALTIDFSKFSPGQKFHGLRRIHLNNSIEDPSYCNEVLGSELFRQAGVPAPRVTHAVVILNGRRLGLYVLKEGFTEDFLVGYFAHPSGNLYEPDEGHDINERLKRNSIQAPRTGRASLLALAGAVRGSDSVDRWDRLQQLLDINEFISFVAMEVMICHRDGYCLARNNFRVYEDSDSGKIMFFPHGMDQLLGNPAAPWQPQMSGLVARAVMETPNGKRKYRQCLENLVTNLLQPDLLTRRVDELAAQLQPVLLPGEFTAIQKETFLLKDRIRQRRTSLDSQLAQPELKSVAFDNGPVALEGWTEFDSPSQGIMERCKGRDGLSVLHILTRSETAASWRTKVLLGPGRYRFEGQASVLGVKPLPFGAHQGAGLRVGGASRQSENLVGNSSWRTLKAEFQVETDGTVVEFICELRGVAGQAWFDVASLRLIRLP